MGVTGVGSGPISLVWDGTGAYVSPGAIASGVTGGTSEGLVLLDPTEATAFGGNGSDWLIWNSDGSAGDNDYLTLSLSGTTFTPDGVVSNYGDAAQPPPPFSVSTSYSDGYTYDLDGNRLTDTHTGPGGGATGNTSYAYNGDNELTSQTNSLTGSTSFTYDANGSLTNDGTHKYVYNLRNKLVQLTDESGNVLASYVYDDAGNRVQETSGGMTTYYLTDTNNPTGYAQPIEAWTVAPANRTSSTKPATTYIRGNTVLAQADGSGNVTWLLTDGHGSTVALANSSGTITSAFFYDAFGGAIGNWNPATAGTIFLFGGDAVYDPISGLYMNGDGTRDRRGFGFIQADTAGNGSNSDPISLYEYLYAGADPLNAYDPSGHDLISTLGAIAIQTTLIAAELAPIILPVIQAATIASGITFVESLLVLQLMQTGYLPADGAQYVATIAKYTGIGFVAGLFASDLIDGVASQAPVISQQLSRDEEVDGEIAPAVLSTSRSVAQNSLINAEKDRDVTRLQQNGAFQIRVDQRQVANDGEEVFQRGINRPDVQGLFTNGKPVYIEYDTSRSELLARRNRILSNEPGSTVILKWFDSNGNYTIIP